ncbi:Rieske (2Fe-2S) protein [Paenibacillus cremeus]|uniref:Rieske 2Fe-2S domain-containing protein n=1 Tax=Paenibacillus cremeus TaxID=2163881 RepID=A0A559JHN6_9BACL|nr:Rieske 2Fe-2S domain-containing protein [Paenibacillus cremeus]TVX99392.1 Rieske 2Fe-2S domain-containing protein [Paenibacillus cremeus]
MAKVRTRYLAARVEEFEKKDRMIVELKGIEIGLFLVNGNYYAWRNICPHAAAPICEGVVCGTRLPSQVYQYEYGRDKEILRCPWHGWEFGLTDGKHLVESGVRLRGYAVEVEGNDIYVLM